MSAPSRRPERVRKAVGGRRPVPPGTSARVSGALGGSSSRAVSGEGCGGEGEGLDRLETHELFSTLARTALHLDALQRDSLRDHPLSFTEYSVLRLLQRAPKKRLAPSVLAEAIVCTTGAMTKMVDRLEKSGFVSRSPDPNDRRGVLVGLQPTGNRIANAAAKSYQQGRDRVLAELGPDEASSIQMNLQRLLEALENDWSERE